MNSIEELIWAATWALEFKCQYDRGLPLARAARVCNPETDVAEKAARMAQSYADWAVAAYIDHVFPHPRKV